MTAVRFKIEKIVVEGKSRVLTCRCGSEDAYMTARLDHPGRIKMCCDNCRENEDLNFSFNSVVVEHQFGLDAEDEIAKALEEEIKFNKYKPYYDKYASYEEKFDALLRDALDEYKEDKRNAE